MTDSEFIHDAVLIATSARIDSKDEALARNLSKRCGSVDDVRRMFPPSTVDRISDRDAVGSLGDGSQQPHRLKHRHRAVSNRAFDVIRHPKGPAPCVFNRNCSIPSLSPAMRARRQHRQTKVASVDTTLPRRCTPRVLPRCAGERRGVWLAVGI